MWADIVVRRLVDTCRLHIKEVPRQFPVRHDMVFGDTGSLGERVLPYHVRIKRPVGGGLCQFVAETDFPCGFPGRGAEGEQKILRSGRVLREGGGDGRSRRGISHPGERQKEGAVRVGKTRERPRLRDLFQPVPADQRRRLPVERHKSVHHPLTSYLSAPLYHKKMRHRVEALQRMFSCDFLFDDTDQLLISASRLALFQSMSVSYPSPAFIVNV